MIVAFYSQASYAGKDTCADMAAAWCDRNGILCQRDAFAWDGKVVAADALGIQGTREEKVAAIDRIKNGGAIEWFVRPAPGGEWEGGDVTGRDLLIGLLGDPEKRTGIRGLDEKFWTHQVLRRDHEFQCDQLAHGGGFTIVSDLRFIEEAEAVWHNDGVIVEVVRPGAPRFNEQRVPWVSQTIQNDDTIDVLHDRVDAIMDGIHKTMWLTR